MEKEKFFEERKDWTLKFFQSWELHQSLSRIAEQEAEEASLEGEGSSSAVTADVAPFNAELAPGQIRLLSQPDKLTYVALLRRWEKNSFVVMPFSHFSEPATDEELKAEYDRGTFARVLQGWNVRTLQDETLEKSWLVDRLSENELEQAWTLWTSGMTGRELPNDILQRTGLPIYRDDDPRLEYKREELDNFAKVDAQDLATAEKPDIDWIGKLDNWLPLPESKRPAALAAGAVKPNLQFTYEAVAAEQSVTVFIEYSHSAQELSLCVYDADGKTSKLLDNYFVLDRQSGDPIGEIRQGTLRLSYQLTEESAIAIVSPDGEELPGKFAPIE